ncbi:hypothetical protein [Rhodococcus jostii]|uniref:Uncharacterized protein n=1 Tax=Rhodococcus jostii TaxID=132919 RepID=A0ABU4CTB1_RHOJO|nr:hypothetical protein [Rhodococcus jostii]MDV6286827.1 hypothetical protein [Rhodococcus jostii]
MPREGAGSKYQVNSGMIASVMVPGMGGEWIQIGQDCVTCGKAAFRHYIYAGFGGLLIETDVHECATKGCPGPVAISDPIVG